MLGFTLWGEPILHLPQEVHPVDNRAPIITEGERLPGGGLQSAKDLALAPLRIIDLLFGPRGGSHQSVDQFAAREALGDFWPHLI